MSKHYCCVPGCVDSGDSHQVLHLFPNPNKYPDRFRSWVLAVGGDVLGLANQYIYANRRVCHRHFKEKDCCRNNRISQSAVPANNLPGISLIPRVMVPGPSILRSIQNIGHHYPTTSRDRFEVFGPEYATKHDLFQETSTMDNKENELLTKTNQENMDVIPSAEHAGSQSIEGTEKSEPHTAVKRTHEKIDVISSPKPAANHSIERTQKNARAVVRPKFKCIHMTPQEEILYKKLRKAQIKLSKCRTKKTQYLKSVKMAQNLMTNSTFVEVINNMPQPGKILTLLQFRERKKKIKGRRFTLKEKLVSLSIYKQSPKAYRFLRKMFLLPASQTLDKLIRRVVIKPGINEKVFSELKTKSDKMKPDHKLCVLLFDEVALQANINYNPTEDKINGIVKEEQDVKLADHALVFMLRGLLKNYKQPIAYMFCSGATKAVILKKYIKEIIEQVNKAGFNIVATVCDQGTNNQKAIKDLIEETRVDNIKSGKEDHRRNTFIVNGNEITPLFDPPHLIKGVRNNLLKNNLRYKNEQGQTCTAKWEHIQLLYAENPAYNGIRLMPKLTDQHVVPEKIAKMKVKFATQIFSRSVASNMGFLADKGILPSECKETADILLLFDNLFDSMNGSYNKKGSHAKPYLSALTPNSPHHKLWVKAKKILKSMEFITSANQRANVPPTLKNFIFTIEGLEYLINKMAEQHKIRSIWTRHLNQDPLENFFGSIRSHGYRNNNPSPAAFQSSFTALIINNLTSAHAAGANCEEDFCESLHSYMITTNNKSDNHVQTLHVEHLFIEPVPLEEKQKDQKLMGALSYVSGFFLKKCREKIFKNCETCNDEFNDKDKKIEYLNKREYSGRGWLSYPNEKFIKIISNMQDIIFTVLKQNDMFEMNNINEYIKTVIYSNLDLTNRCVTHKNLLAVLCNYVVKFFLHSYCKDVNKILKGKRKQEDFNDKLQLLAENYFKKSIKKKNK